MGVVTPAAHQLMRDTEYIYPPLEGIRGERPEQDRRRSVGTSGEEPQQTGGNWTLSPLLCPYRRLEPSHSRCETKDPDWEESFLCC